MFSFLERPPDDHGRYAELGRARTMSDVSFTSDGRSATKPINDAQTRRFRPSFFSSRTVPASATAARRASGFNVHSNSLQLMTADEHKESQPGRLDKMMSFTRSWSMPNGGSNSPFSKHSSSFGSSSEDTDGSKSTICELGDVSREKLWSGDISKTSTDTGATVSSKQESKISVKYVVMLALLAQTLKGFGPGLSRYLQHQGGFKSLLLVTTRNSVAAVLIAPIVAYRLGWRVFMLQGLYILILAWVPTQVSSFYASRFTLSYYVQLIHLGVPFVVALISRMVLKEELPRYTYHALVLTLIGGFLTISGGLLEGEKLNFTSEGYLGLFLALLATIGAGIGTVYYSTVKQGFPTEGVVWLQNFFVALVIAPISAFTDDWSIWKHLSTETVIILLLEILFYVVSLFFEIFAVRRLGAPLVGTVTAWSLVSAVFFGAIFLSEPLNAINIVGCLVVVLSVTWYLVEQFRTKMRAKAETFAEL